MYLVYSVKLYYRQNVALIQGFSISCWEKFDRNFALVVDVVLRIFFCLFLPFLSVSLSHQCFNLDGFDLSSLASLLVQSFQGKLRQWPAKPVHLSPLAHGYYFFFKLAMVLYILPVFL